MSFVVNKEIYNERLSICKACPHFNKGFCGDAVIGKKVMYKNRLQKLCGCQMFIKGKLAFAKCPIGKWGWGNLPSEKMDRAKAFLAKYTDEKGMLKNGEINAQEAAQVWHELSGEYKTASCSGCIKEIIYQIQRYVKEKAND